MFLASLAMALIKAIVFLYTLVTYPFYALFSGACLRVSRRLATSRARVVSRSADEITLRAIPYPCAIREEIQTSPYPIRTMDKLFQFAVKRYGARKALETLVLQGKRIKVDFVLCKCFRRICSPFALSS